MLGFLDAFSQEPEIRVCEKQNHNELRDDVNFWLRCIEASSTGGETILAQSRTFAELAGQFITGR